MRTLIAYYSLYGATRELAEEISERLGCDIEEIKDTKQRRGIIGFLAAGFDAAKGKTTVLQPLEKDPADYDLLVIGSPVWSGSLAPAVRTYLLQAKPKRYAFFCTAGSDSGGRLQDDLEKISGKPVAFLRIQRKALGRRPGLEGFLSALGWVSSPNS
jgi:flavodoxin